MEHTANVGPNKTVHLVIGPPGAGKSWVCRQLGGVYLIDSDWVKRSDLSRVIVSATWQLLPVVMDLTFRVSTTIKTLPGVDFKVYAIVEEREIVAARLVGRGGKVTPTLDSRIKRVASLAKRYGAFTGTSSQVLWRLSLTLDLVPGVAEIRRLQPVCKA